MFCYWCYCWCIATGWVTSKVFCVCVTGNFYTPKVLASVTFLSHALQYNFASRISRKNILPRLKIYLNSKRRRHEFRKAAPQKRTDDWKLSDVFPWYLEFSECVWMKHDVNEGEYSRNISINSWRLICESALTSWGWQIYMFVDHCLTVSAVGVLALYATFFIRRMYNYVSNRGILTSDCFRIEGSYAKLQGHYGSNPPINKFRTGRKNVIASFP